MLEACHWFMAALFIGWSTYFVYTLWRFSKARNPKADYHGVQSKASAHLEFSVVVGREATSFCWVSPCRCGASG